MPEIFNRRYEKSELLKKVGSIRQLGGVKKYELAEGREKGVEVVEFRTGSGLMFRALPGRGMDISLADFRGAPLAWLSPTGETAPEHFEPEGLGWLRSFFGGLLTTCGLTCIGDPSEDEGEELGLHGRISNIRAENVYAGGEWVGDEYVMTASGKVSEACVFGPNISLYREIRAKLGSSKLEIVDSVENEGFSTSPHMILYHINIGFPVVDEGSELISPAARVNPLNEQAAGEPDLFGRFHGPSKDYEKRLYSHEMPRDKSGKTTVALVNRNFGDGLGVYLSYDVKELPFFIEWKMNGEGEYVVGIEPANALVGGRKTERENGRLQFLEPGERRNYRLELGVLESADEIDSLEENIKKSSG